MPRKALITGITGQDGSYLAEFLLQKNYRVFGLIRRSSTINFERIKHLQDDVELVPGDLLDQSSLITALQKTQPDEVYNLAAQSFVPTSWSQPVLTGEFTILRADVLFDAGKSPNPAIDVASLPVPLGDLLRAVRSTEGLRTLRPAQRVAFRFR